MAGKTGMLVGLFRGEYVHLPLKVVTSGKTVDPCGNIWMRVIESTGQPLLMSNAACAVPAPDPRGLPGSFR
jgi:6-phosphofructokinase 1